MRGRGLTLALTVLALSGCAVWRWPDEPLCPFVRPDPLWDDADVPSMLEALRRTEPLFAAHRQGRSAAVVRRLAGVLRATEGDPTRREMDLRRAFHFRRATRRVLLTGYYEPEIAASETPSAAYPYPIYRRPPDLVRGEPYATRSELDAGALAGRDLEIAWASDPVDLFLLHVQGSGHARLPDGRRIGLRFAATNERPYTSLGRVMIERGLVTRSNATVPDLRRALAALPLADRLALLRTNDRYVFFRRSDGEALGSAGVALTPGRSVAVDPALIEPGTVLYLETRSFRRFVIAHDTGAAITGGRVDLFLGSGRAAATTAGGLREHGRLWIVSPR